MTQRLAIWSGRRPWLSLGVWGLALVAAIGLTAAFLGDALSGDEELTSNPDSRRADALIDQRFADEGGGPGEDATEVVVVRSPQSTVDEPSFRQQVETIAAELRAAGATQATTFYDTGEQRLVSRDRDATVILVALGRDAEDQIERIVDAVQGADGRDGFETAITGEFTVDADFDTLAEEDLLNGELAFGLPAALIVLLIVFGSVVAGLIPVLVSLVSITVALALTGLVGQAFPLSVFATNMLTGMGLALGIDYSLFILSRFREERAHGREKLDAIAAVGSTASRAVLFSGLAFTLAMVGLLLVPSTVMRSLADRRDRGRAGLGRRGADAPARAAQPARRSHQRPADPVFRQDRRPRAESLLVPDGASGDPAAGDQPLRFHGDPARDGRAGARPAVGRGRRQHAPRPARRQAGVLGPERGVPGRDDRPGGDRDRRRRRVAGRSGRNRAPARAAGERGAPRQPRAGGEQRR